LWLRGMLRTGRCGTVWWAGVAFLALIATCAHAEVSRAEVSSATLRVMLLPEVHAHLDDSSDAKPAWPNVPGGSTGKIATPLHGAGITDLDSRPSGSRKEASPNDIKVMVGETVRVELDAFGANEHEWFLVSSTSMDVGGMFESVKVGDAGILEGDGDRKFEASTNAIRGTDLTGLRDGHDVFTFTAVRPGNAVVAFQYARPPSADTKDGTPVDPIMSAVVQVSCSTNETRNASSVEERTIRVMHPPGGISTPHIEASDPLGSDSRVKKAYAIPSSSGYVSEVSKATIELGGNVRVELETLLGAEADEGHGWVFAGSHSVDLGEFASMKQHELGVLRGGRTREFVANTNAAAPAAPGGVGYSAFTFTVARVGNTIASFEYRPDGRAPMQTALVEIKCVDTEDSEGEVNSDAEL